MTFNNPLRAYFRQPSIYIPLVSGGEFYPPGGVDIPPTGEVPIYPMTARDEVAYRTPDALLNGSAVADVISSCVPNIHDVWQMPSIDLDSILIAIRIASYGHQMDFNTRCPHCGTLSDRAIDLRVVLGEIGSPDYKTTLRAGDLEIFFRPLTYREMNENNKLQWQHRKSMSVIQDSEMPEEDKMRAIGDSLKKLAEITTDAIAHSIAVIRTPDGMVTDTDFIIEFLTECERTVYTKIQNHVIDIRSRASIPSIDITCGECQTQYKQEITLDMSSFFGPAS